MENIKHWKVSAITAIITDDMEIALFAQEEIKAISKAIRDSYGKYIKVNMAGEVKLKIDFIEKMSFNYTPNWEREIGMKLLIQSAEFPNPQGWYHLINFYPKHLGSILKQCSFVRETGEFIGTFSPITSPSSDLIEYSSLASESMKEYDCYIEETIRTLNCDINKKTKKWIPGHRYDSQIETRFLICKTKIRKTEETFPETPELDAWIYTHSIKEEKTISEILNTRVFGKDPQDLKIMTTIPSGYVESGEVLKNDYSNNIDDYLDVILEKTKDYYFSDLYKTSSYIYYCLIPYFLVQNTTNIKFKENLLYFIQTLGNQCLYNLYDRDGVMIHFGAGNDRKLGKDRTDIDNRNSLIDLIYFRIPDKNINKIQYYSSLFDHFGININNVCEDLIKSWNPSELKKDLDTYLKNIKYFKDRKSYSDVNLDLRKNSKLIISRTTDDLKLYDLVGKGSLYDTIIKMLNEQPNPYKHSQYLGGSKNFAYIEANITVLDIINYAKQKYNEIPEDLKSEILQHQFCNVHLMYDADKDLE